MPLVVPDVWKIMADSSSVVLAAVKGVVSYLWKRSLKKTAPGTFLICLLIQFADFAIVLLLHGPVTSE